MTNKLSDETVRELINCGESLMKVEALEAIAQDPHHKDTDHIYLAMEKLKSTIKKAKAELEGE